MQLLVVVLPDVVDVLDEVEEEDEVDEVDELAGEVELEVLDPVVELVAVDAEVVLVP
jgi:hypothetical protein